MFQSARPQRYISPARMRTCPSASTLSSLTKRSMSVPTPPSTWVRHFAWQPARKTARGVLPSGSYWSARRSASRDSVEASLLRFVPPLASCSCSSLTLHECSSYSTLMWRPVRGADGGGIGGGGDGDSSIVDGSSPVVVGVSLNAGSASRFSRLKTPPTALRLRSLIEISDGGSSAGCTTMPSSV